MKKTILLAVMFLVAISTAATGQTAVSRYHKSTFSFADRQGQTLYLDRYVDADREGTQPCVLFVFGGAFARGARDMDKYIPYFDFLIDNGYTVVSIDYRLGLKEMADSGDLDQERLAAQFIKTVDMAVEDLFDATVYVLGRAREWNIDPSRIVLNGSSAGAVTVLQAEYAHCNGLMTSDRLPADFRYAGVMSFAGAILLTEGSMEWKRRPCPIMLMHGDADLQVPYSTLRYGDLGFYGASFIADNLEQRDYPYWFYSFEDYGHQISSDPLQQNQGDVLSFLTRFVERGQQLKIRTDQKEIGRPVVDNKDFEIDDFIRGNYDR